MVSRNIGYIRKLDHLRFFAALLVGIYHFFHFQMPAYVPHNHKGLAYMWPKAEHLFSALIVEGHTGVSLFMVLSGLIFAAIGYKREIIYKDFLMNRILRIIPLFGVAIFIASMLAAPKTGLGNFLTSFLFPVSGVDGVSFLGITPHLWTIRTEFQFYLLFPFLILFVDRYGVRYALALLVFLALVRAMVWYSPQAGLLRTVSYWSILGRLDQFMLGMLGGCLYCGRARWSLPSWLKHWALAPIAFAVPLWLIYWFNQMGGFQDLPESSPVWIWWPDVEALGWLVFVLTYLKCDFDWPFGISRFLGWMGTLSFSLYVNHWLFVADFTYHDFSFYGYHLPQFSKNLTNFAALGFILVLLPFLTLFSWLTYSVIERPFFEMRRSYIRKPKAETSAVEEKPLIVTEPVRPDPASDQPVVVAAANES